MRTISNITSLQEAKRYAKKETATEISKRISPIKARNQTKKKKTKTKTALYTPGLWFWCFHPSHRCNSSHFMEWMQKHVSYTMTGEKRYLRMQCCSSNTQIVCPLLLHVFGRLCMCICICICFERIDAMCCSKHTSAHSHQEQQLAANGSTEIHYFHPLSTTSVSRRL